MRKENQNTSGLNSSIMGLPRGRCYAVLMYSKRIDMGIHLEESRVHSSVFISLRHMNPSRLKLSKLLRLHVRPKTKTNLS